MAGVKYVIKPVGIPEIHDAINSLLQRGNNLTPAMRDIGEILINGHIRRFEDEKSPEGIPWAKHTPTTIELYEEEGAKNIDRILTKDGELNSQWAYEASPDSLEFGTTVEYGAIHHFGGRTSPRSKIPNAVIPARPFLGVDDGDRKEIYQMLSKFLSDH